MAVQGGYISWRIRQAVLPFVRIYGQWVEERIIPLADQLKAMADAVEQQAYDELMSQPVGEYYSGDGSEEAEQAFDVGLSFYENITSMYQGYSKPVCCWLVSRHRTAARQYHKGRGN